MSSFQLTEQQAQQESDVRGASRRGSPLIGGFMIVTGIAMAGMWSMFLLTGQVPELQTKPWSIALHLTAEFTTAIMLLVSGFAMLRAARWAPRAALFALGMLVYTVIQSSGYYFDLAQPAFVVMFAVLGVLAVSCAVRLGRDSSL